MIGAFDSGQLMKYFDDCRFFTIHTLFSAILREDIDYFDHDYRI